MARSTPSGPEALPYVDEHTIRIPTSRDQAWTGLERFVAARLCRPHYTIFARLLGTVTPGGFEVAERTRARRLTLVGRHRFSRYQLIFELTDAPDDATTVHAKTYAAFPGLPGRVYRALVIGTGVHRLATNRLLRTIGRFTADEGDQVTSQAPP
jgi:hypothetical protein